MKWALAVLYFPFGHLLALQSRCVPGVWLIQWVSLIEVALALAIVTQLFAHKNVLARTESRSAVWKLVRLISHVRGRDCVLTLKSMIGLLPVVCTKSRFCDGFAAFSCLCQRSFADQGGLVVCL